MSKELRYAATVVLADAHDERMSHDYDVHINSIGCSLIRHRKCY